MRRRSRPVAVLLALPLLALGCGDDRNDRAGDSTRSVTHRFGVVVAPGATDLDSLLAVGVTPVGAVGNGTDTDFFGWVQQQAGSAGVRPVPVDGRGAPDIEAVAALQPDLILLVNSYLDQEALFQSLSPIAPVVASRTDDVSVEGRQEHFRQVASAVGRDDRAESMIGEVERSIAAAARAHPEFAGRTVSFGGVFSPTAPTTVFGERDFARVLLGQLGLGTPPRQLAELPGLAEDAGQAQADVSLERLDLLDADALILGYFDDEVRTAFEGQAVFAALPVVSNGNYLPISADLVAATRLPSVLSVPFVVERLVPRLATVLR